MRSSPMAEMITNEDFGGEYNKASFWKKVRDFASIAGKQVIEKALVLYYCLIDKDTPKWAKTVIVSALGYFILPLDAIVDVKPIFGFSDDLGVLVVASAIVAVHIKTEHREKAKKKLKE